jgi:tetratricopeptide (TPR) repeat protein
LGPEHPDTLMSVSNLGFLYQAQGRYDEAEPLYQRALAGREKTLGLEHPDTLTSVTISAAFMASRVAMPKRNRYIEERWRAARRCWGRSIRIR